MNFLFKILNNQKYLEGVKNGFIMANKFILPLIDNRLINLQNSNKKDDNLTKTPTDDEWVKYQQQKQKENK